MRAHSGALVFGLAALLLVGLAVGLFVRERQAFELGERSALSAQARSYAGTVTSLAGELVVQAAGDGAAAVRGQDGRFVHPAEPEPLLHLTLAPLTDTEGRFFLDQAASLERDPATQAEARESYRAAGSSRNTLVCQLIALHRHAALERRAGDEVQARRLTEDLVGLLTPETCTTSEALLARVLLHRADAEREGSGDPDLAHDLVKHLGLDADPAVLGLLSQLGPAAQPVLAARRTQLARITRLRDLVPPADVTRGAVVLGAHLVAWAPDEDGGLRFAEAPLPSAPAGTFTDRADRASATHDGLVEMVTLGSLLPGQVCVASLPRTELAQRRTRHLGLIGGGLILLLVLGLAAVMTTWRAVRRERAVAEERAAFVQRVGHDLRTPLAVMRLYAETLVEGRARNEEEARSFAQTIVDEAGALSDLAQSALDLERLDAGSVGTTRVELGALVRGLFETHRPLFAEGQLTITTLGVPVLVRADDAALRGAIGNLIANGRVHGGGLVEVRLESKAGLARVRVLDRGPGLPVERAVLFERFTRGPDTTARGAGLGLALASEVARAAGGRLEGLDREGGGCEMRLELPREMNA